MPGRSRSRSRMELSQRCACGKWFWTEQAHREHVASHECPLYERYLAAPVRVHCLLPEPPLPPPRRASASSHTSVPSPPRETGAPSGSSRCCEEPPWRRLKSNPPTPKLGPHEIAIGASVPLIDKWICYSCPNHIAPEQYELWQFGMSDGFRPCKHGCGHWTFLGKGQDGVRRCRNIDCNGGYFKPPGEWSLIRTVADLYLRIWIVVHVWVVVHVRFVLHAQLALSTGEWIVVGNSCLAAQLRRL